MKTYTLDASISGYCTITVKAKSKEEAEDLILKGQFNDCELNDWEVDYNSNEWGIDNIKELK